MAKTTLKEVREILAAVEALRQQKGLSRHQISDSLGIPFETFRRWFQEKRAYAPSRAHLAKLRDFVEEKTQPLVQSDELWKKIREWWRTQHRYSSVQQLAEEVGWTTKGLRACLQNESLPPRLVVERLAAFEDGSTRHSRFLGGVIQANTLSPDYLRETQGPEETQLAYATLIVGKEIIAYNDKSGGSDDYLEKLLGFYFKLKNRIAPTGAFPGKRGVGRPKKLRGG